MDKVEIIDEEPCYQLQDDTHKHEHTRAHMYTHVCGPAHTDHTHTARTYTYIHTYIHSHIRKTLKTKECPLCSARKVAFQKTIETKILGQ